MIYNSKDHSVTGRKNDKTKEKIRINIRYLLNKHKAASLFLSNYSDSKLSFHLEKDGFKVAFVVYKSSALESCSYYDEQFNDLYLNELTLVEKLKYVDEGDPKAVHKVVLAFRKTKKSF